MTSSPLHHAANFVPFVLETGRRLGLEADALLKPWARLAAGDDMKFAKMSTMATFILQQYREVVGVALQRGNERTRCRGRWVISGTSCHGFQILSPMRAAAVTVTPPRFLREFGAVAACSAAREPS